MKLLQAVLALTDTPIRLSLKHRWLLLALLSVGTPLLFWGGLDHLDPRSIKQLWSLGHILYFALATLLLMGWKPVADLPAPWSWLLLLMLALLAGVGIELLQYGTRRSPDVADVIRDLTGTLLALCFGPGRHRIRSLSRRRLLQGLVSTLLLFQLWPLSVALIDEFNAWRQFPLLAGFETPFEVSRWSGNARFATTEAPFSTTGKVLEIELTNRRYSGIHLEHFPRDWRGFTGLRIRIYNPHSEALRIVCRIHDLSHEEEDQPYDDRFNRRFFVQPGWNSLEIDLEAVAEAPGTRRMDLSGIANLGLFAVSPRRPHRLYLDEVRLLR